MRILFVALLVVQITFMGGCKMLPGADRGEVYDLETRQPIEGAQVTAHRAAEDGTPLTSLSYLSTGNGTFDFEREAGIRISHVVASAGGYYPAVGVHRGSRIYLRAVPYDAQPALALTYDVEIGAEDVGIRLADGALVPADEADVVIFVRKQRKFRKAVLLRASGGVRRVVSPMPHGVALEPEIAFDNIVEAPKGGYTRWRTRGTSSYGWTAYATYAVRTRDRLRHAKILLAAFPNGDAKKATIVVRYRLADADRPRFVATIP